MRINQNTIAFKKNVMVCQDLGLDNKELVFNVQNFLMNNGYMLTEKAFIELSKDDAVNIINFQKEISYYFEQILGSIKNKSLSELFSADKLGNEVYTSFYSALQLLWKKEDNNLHDTYEYVEFKRIDYVTEKQFKDIFTKLVSINTALTPTDFKIVEWFAKQYGDKNFMPSNIPFKENLCMLASLGLDVPVKTPTDVLRIAFYLSTGKSDLILEPKMVQASSWNRNKVKNPDRKKTYFKSFPRKDRKYLLKLLNRVANPYEMILKKGMWIQLGNILHPGDYASYYPKAFEAFDALRNKSPKSWYSDLNKAMSKNLNEGLKVLSQRPGEFARRLDALLRKNPKSTSGILIEFRKCSEKISSKVLWELYTHFENRRENQTRKIVIKGARKPVVLPTLPPMEPSLIDDIQITILSCMSDRFEKLDKLGKVYIEEELRKIPAPTNMRTLSESSIVTVRGTRMPLLCNKPVLRAYVHWTAGVDLDLSMSFIGKDKSDSIVCYYGNSNPHTTIKHSGDVIPRIKGNWAEYIDIDLEKVPYKYGLLTLRNFSGGSLSDKGARIGFMERENKSSSKTWSPKTITNSFIPSSSGGNLNLLIIDFESKEWILVDEDASGIPVEMKGNIDKYVKSLSELPKLSAYDILRMHVEARGQQVTEIEEADHIFKFDDFSTSYETIANYML